MYWGSGALSVLVGVVGGVLLVCAAVFARRLGRRRVTGAAGAGLLLLGLSLSGLIEVVGRALAILSFNPLRWIGLAAVVLGLLLLSAAGFLPRRSGRRQEEPPRRVESGRSAAADDDLAEIEEILRRRGIT